MVNPVAYRVMSGHEGHPARRTDRTTNIKLLEPCTLSCEPVNIRRFHVRMAEMLPVTPALIIGENENNIRARCDAVTDRKTA